MNSYDVFAKAAAAAGCPEDQTAESGKRRCLFARTAAWPPVLPPGCATMPAGRRPLATAARVAVASRTGCWHRWAWMIASAAEGLKCLLLRKVGKANLEHFEDLRRKLFNRLAHEFSAFRGVLKFCQWFTHHRGAFPKREGH